MSNARLYSLVGIAWAMLFVLALTAPVHAGTFMMNCYPAGPVYLVTYDTDTRTGIITGSVSHRSTSYKAKDVVDRPDKHMLYVAMTAPGQTRTLYLAFDYSGTRDVSAIRTKDGDQDRRDKCEFRPHTAPVPSPAPVSPQPQAVPQATTAPAHMHVAPCDGVFSTRECAVVAISGDIVSGDRDQFVELTRGMQKVQVFLSGPGGLGREAINIGEIIHARGWGTSVPGGTYCHSACAYIWVAGSTHTMGLVTELAWHSGYLSTDDQHADGNSNALLGKYLGDMGYTYDEIDTMIGNDPNDMRVIRRDEAGEITKFNCRYDGSRCVR
jgi:hypothetical protein